MCKINFVTEREDQSWILRPIAQGWSKHIHNSTITSLVPNNEADVNVFVNYKLYDSCKTKTIALFTHREDNSWSEIASIVDYCLAQSKAWLPFLPKEKSDTVHIGLADNMYINTPLKIGIVGRDYPNGRKRYEWVEEIKQMPGVEVHYTGGTIGKDDMPNFYDTMDVILVTSKIEGGPFAIKEAIARRKPVITTPVGYAFEYPCTVYSTLDELKNIINAYTATKDEWKVGADKITSIAKTL